MNLHTIFLGKIKKYMMKTKLNFLQKLTIIFYSVYAIKCVWLAFASDKYFSAYNKILELFTMGCLPLGLYTVLWNKSIVLSKNIFVYILPFIFYIYSILYNYYLPNYAVDTFTLAVILFYLLFSTEIKIKIFDLFYWIIQATNIIALVVFVSFTLNIDIGFETVPYYEKNIPANYVKWLIFAIYKSSSELRLCSIFNEPGALGTVCALLFIARYTNSKSWEKLLLLITIVCTFSVAGFILIIVFFSVKIVIKDPKNAIYICLLLVAFLIAPYIDFKNKFVNDFFDRFMITDKGLAGDNRTKLYFDKIYKRIMSTKDKWFGYGKGYPVGTGTLSYKTYIVEYGIFGFVFWIFDWICAAIKMSKKNKDCLVFIILFVVSLYQRPRLIQSIYGYVLLFGGILWIQQKRRENNLCHKLQNL